jgi:type IV secretion system protein TrbF
MATAPNKLPQYDGDPYQQARAEYSDRYASLAQGKRNWQCAALGFFLLALITGAANLIQVRQVKRVPYVVQEDPAGEIVTIMPQLSAATSPISLQVIESEAVDQFIRDSRTAIDDFNGEDTLLRWVKAHAGGAAGNFLGNYYEDGVHNPHLIAKQHSIAVTVTSNVPIGPHSFQVRFVKQYLDHNGMHINSMAASHWVALVHTQIHSMPDGPPNNPFDFKVTAIQWSPEQTPQTEAQ